MRVFLKAKDPLTTILPNLTLASVPKLLFKSTSNRPTM